MIFHVYGFFFYKQGSLSFYPIIIIKIITNLCISLEYFDVFFAEDEEPGPSALRLFAAFNRQLGGVGAAKFLRDSFCVILKIMRHTVIFKIVLEE
jgi:hypothetical protein